MQIDIVLAEKCYGFVRDSRHRLTRATKIKVAEFECHGGRNAEGAVDRGELTVLPVATVIFLG